MTRLERHEQVTALKAQGLTFKEIAARLGLGLSTVADAYYDPSGEKVRERKARNDGTCLDCGGRTASGGERVAPERCRGCRIAYDHENARWTPETVITAIQYWADEHGGVPPVATDWNAAARDSSLYPATSTVMVVFGKWADAIRAAGFDANAPGRYGRDGDTPEIVAETIRLYESGLSAPQVARLMNISPPGVLHRLRVAGVPRRDSADAVRLWHSRQRAT